LSLSIRAFSLLVGALRRCRYLALKSFSPIEQLTFRIGGISEFPPTHLRRAVGATAVPDASSMHYLLLMKMAMGAKSSSNILDIGCGCGLLEQALAKYVTTGRVVGIDIHMPSIEWATRNISSRHPNIGFTHSDIYNAAYWPAGKISAAEFFQQFDAGPFDIIVAKSLFTHMLIDELNIYFNAIAKNLAAGGKGILSFFLLNDYQKLLQEEGKGAFKLFPILSGDPYSVKRRSAPSAAVGYDESFIRQLLGECRLNCTDIIYGSWSGRPDAVLFQDVVFVERIAP
jgi:SAM-dependent methyltransferase